MTTRTVDTAAMIPAVTAQLRDLTAYAATDLGAAERAQVEALIASAKGALISLVILRETQRGVPMSEALDAVCGAGSYARTVDAAMEAARAA